MENVLKMGYVDVTVAIMAKLVNI